MLGILLLLGPGAGVPHGATSASTPYSIGWEFAWRLPLFIGCIPPAAMAWASFLEMRDQKQPQQPQPQLSKPQPQVAPPLVRSSSLSSHDINGTHWLRRATSFHGMEDTSLR